jgi:hypothetical protein
MSSTRPTASEVTTSRCPGGDLIKNIFDCSRETGESLHSVVEQRQKSDGDKNREVQNKCPQRTKKYTGAPSSSCREHKLDLEP